MDADERSTVRLFEGGTYNVDIRCLRGAETALVHPKTTDVYIVREGSGALRRVHLRGHANILKRARAHRWLQPGSAHASADQRRHTGRPPGTSRCGRRRAHRARVAALDRSYAHLAP